MVFDSQSLKKSVSLTFPPNIFWIIFSFFLMSFVSVNVEAKKKVTLQLRYDHQFQSAGFYAAVWNGYYEEAGIEVEILPSMNTDGALVDYADGIRSGSVDFCVAAGDALIEREKGLPIVLLASIYQKSAVEILSRPDAKLLSPANLQNLRTQGSLLERADHEFLTFLHSEGIDRNKLSFERAEKEQKPKYSIQRLVSGEVDALLTTSYSALWLMRERGIPFTRMRPSAYKVDFCGDSLFASQKIIDSDPDLVEKFTEASLNGWRYALDNPEEISKKIVAEFPRVLEIDDPFGYNVFLASQVREAAVYPLVEFGHINTRRWLKMYDDLKRAGLVDKNLDIDSFVFSPKEERAEKIQFRYYVAFLTLVALSCIFVGFVFRSRRLRKRETQSSLRKLEKSESRLRTIVEAEPESVLVLNGDLNFVEINSAGLEAIEAKSIDELRNESYIERVLPSYRDDFRKFHEDVLAGKPGKHEYEIVGFRGTQRWMESNATVLLDGSESTMFLSITRDITEQKKSADVIARKDEQLQQMQKMEAVGRLAGGIAHDFNNLLTAINGYSDLSIRSLPEDNKVRSNIVEIKKAGDRAAELTRQLLAFSRKQIMKPKIFNLNQTTSDINKMLERLIGENIKIVSKLAPDLGQINADPGHIEQVIVNLVVNARDAMPNGGRLTIETSNVILDTEYSTQHYPITPGHFVLLAVSDTGIGMDKETQNNIFEPFFTTKETGRGTGLGLATVHGIVKQSGGDIWVYSELGSGTTFKLYFPRVFSEADPLPTPESLESEPFGRATILLVEDNELVSNVTLAILEQQGYSVLKAENGEEALEIGKTYSGTIDLLLTDLIMPRMGGHEVAVQFRQLRPEIKVLFISGYTEHSIVGDQSLSDDDSFLEKPFSPNGLLRKVREILHAREFDKS